MRGGGGGEERGDKVEGEGRKEGTRWRREEREGGRKEVGCLPHQLYHFLCSAGACNRLHKREVYEKSFKRE